MCKVCWIFKENKLQYPGFGRSGASIGNAYYFDSDQ
jgi:hypothetical protein